MAREWKPGDVAAVTYRKEDMPRAVTLQAIRWRYGWIVSGEHGYEITHDKYVSNARPLVVIDPEDREQVEQLLEAWSSLSSGYAELLDEPWSMPAMRLRQALNIIANPTPPKPDEPTGLGAVVATEADGDYVRVSAELANPWLNVQDGRQCHWDGVFAVKVLSEGVRP